MVQFYCLSVVMNIFAGLILVYGIDLTQQGTSIVKSGTEDSLDEAPKRSKEFKGLENRSVRFLIGIISLLVGFAKLFSTYGSIVILGDLLPACAGLMGGASILLEFYTVTTSDTDFELNDRLRVLFIDSRKYIGVLCFVTALLHFILPKVIIL